MQCVYTPKVGTENTGGGGGAGECLVCVCTYMSCESVSSGVLHVSAIKWYILYVGAMPGGAHVCVVKFLSGFMWCCICVAYVAGCGCCVGKRVCRCVYSYS